MSSVSQDGLSYSILNPTGNITALVETPVAVEQQPLVADQIMQDHSEVEQVGFVTMLSADNAVQAELRMAGGEFCGNASICAAALFLLRHGGVQEGPQSVLLKVSGAQDPVEVLLQDDGSGGYDARIHMPRELGIVDVHLSFGGVDGELPLVRMEGISHLVIEPLSTFFWLLSDRESAERAVRSWCSELSADGLGLMFLEGQGSDRRMTPLVFVPESGTVFWENSCASGSSAVGMQVAHQRAAAVDITLHEPGGILRVTSDPATGETWLSGHVSM